MPEGYVIREATPEDIPELAKLFIIARLVKSGAPDRFSPRRLRVWQNRDVVLPLVACPAEAPRLVTAAAEIHALCTGARDMAQLECVATDPAHEGKGLFRALMGRLIHYADSEWKANKLIWTSEAIKDRARARRLYQEIIGAQLIEGTNANFVLRLPYTPNSLMRDHFVDHRL